MRRGNGVHGSRLARVAPLLAIVVGALSATHRAAADPPKLVVHWSAPSSCPDETSVTSEVRGLVAPGVGLEASVAVTARERGFHGVVRVVAQGSVGERTLDNDSCVELAHSVGVILALSATSAPSPPPPPPAAPPVPPPAPPPPPAAVPPAAVPRAAPAPATPRGPVLRISPVASLDVGTLPHPALGGGVDVFVTPGRHIAVGLEGAAWASESGTVKGSKTQGANFSLLTADLDGCYGLLRGRLDVSPCAIAELAHVSSVGFGPNHASPTATWVSLGLGVRSRWEFHRLFALALALDGLVPTQPQSFVIAEPHNEKPTPVHLVGPVAFRATLGPEVRF